MRPYFLFFAVPVIALLGSACVSRTVTVRAQNRGADSAGIFKDNGDQKVEKKIIWIWQDEFSNPK